MVNLLFSTGFSENNELIATTDCTCPGQNIIYQCSVLGGRFTVWGGSIMADGCVVALPHAQFLSSSEYCNNGEVVGQGVMQENNCYISQLTIQASSVMEGRVVECSVDDGSETLINSTTLQFTGGIYV